MVQLKDGDRYMEDHGEKTVVTPPDVVNNPHNFGPASINPQRGSNIIVYTCERPGGDIKGKKIPTTTKVEEWTKYMTTPDRAIKHVFILLGDDELAAYEEPGLIAAYEANNIQVHHIPYASDQSYARIMKELEDCCASKNENAVTHCTHGMGRSGRVAAGWLVYKYGLSVDDAVEEALDAARQYGVERMGSPQQLQQWIAESSLSS